MNVCFTLHLLRALGEALVRINWRSEVSAEDEIRLITSLISQPSTHFPESRLFDFLVVCSCLFPLISLSLSRVTCVVNSFPRRHFVGNSPDFLPS